MAGSARRQAGVRQALRLPRQLDSRTLGGALRVVYGRSSDNAAVQLDCAAVEGARAPLLHRAPPALAGGEAGDGALPRVGAPTAADLAHALLAGNIHFSPAK